jgi:hypothetical protein
MNAAENTEASKINEKAPLVEAGQAVGQTEPRVCLWHRRYLQATPTNVRLLHPDRTCCRQSLDYRL